MRVCAFQKLKLNEFLKSRNYDKINYDDPHVLAWVTGPEAENSVAFTIMAI